MREFGTSSTASRDGLRAAYRDFVGALRDGTAPACSGPDVMAGIRLVDWIHQSARLGRELSAKEVQLAQ